MDTIVAADSGAQAQRRSFLYETHRRSVGSPGRTAQLPSAFRHRLWESFAWISHDLPDLGALSGFLSGVPREPCPFAAAACAQLLVHHSHKLPAELKQGLDEYLTSSLVRLEGLTFDGRNDDRAALAAGALALAGSCYGDTSLSEQAERILDNAVAVLKRRAFLSQYLSMTHTPVILMMLAAMVENSNSKTLRGKARALETRVWDELLAHWHGPSYLLAGPHSQSSWRDSLGLVTVVHALMEHCFGPEVAGMSPSTWLYPPTQFYAAGSEAELADLRAWCCWIAASSYHPLPEQLAYLTDPGWPRYVVGDAEHAGESPFPPTARAGPRPGGAWRRHPPGSSRCVSCMTPGFSLGTASAPWRSGLRQDAFYATMARDGLPGLPLFCRYTAEGEAQQTAPAPEAALDDVTPPFVPEDGRTRALQERNVCLVCYRPRLRCSQAPVTRLSLTVMLPVQLGTPDELWLGDEPVQWLKHPPERWSHSRTHTAQPAPVFVRVQDTFAAIFPLTVSDAGRSEAVSIRAHDQSVLIEFVNYAGAPRQFSLDELLRMQNGFAAVFEDAEGREFAAWRKVALLEAEDRLQEDLRYVRCHCGQTELALAYSPAGEHLLHAAIDGSAVSEKF